VGVPDPVPDRALRLAPGRSAASAGQGASLALAQTADLVLPQAPPLSAGPGAVRGLDASVGLVPGAGPSGSGGGLELPDWLRTLECQV
jgi:hypothetical protein